MERKKKVVLIGSAYPLRGGLASYNERIIREYLNMGYDAEIYTFSLQYPRFLFPGKTQYSSDPAPENLKILIKVNSINPLNWIKVGLELKKKKPDLVLVKFWLPFMAPCFGTIARIIRKNRFSKIISIVDNIIPHEHRLGDRCLARFWVNSVDGFVAMSKNVLEDLKTFSKTKPALFCPHPIYDNYGKTIHRQEALRNLKLSEDFRYILFFGFIRDYKGLDLLLKAFSEEKLKTLPIRLLIAGEFYTDPKSYLELIDKLGIRNRVILSNDFIPDSQVANYFCASSLVVQPYKSATQSGVSQIAYHFNRPMVITNVGGLEEFVKDGVVGYVVNPEPFEIAEAIYKYFEGGKEEEFSKNVEKEKLQFSWSNMIKTIDLLLSKPLT